VLNKATAEKYFGSWQQAVGKTIKIDNNVVLKVNGVLANAPGNSDFPLNVIISYETFKHNPQYNYNEDWGSTSSDYQVYALLPSQVSAAAFNQQLQNFSKEHYTRRSSAKSNFLQPLKDIHFDTRFSNFNYNVTSKSILWTLSLIGIFILAMACINFINLSTAQAVNRSKEVGIRKVLGSSRKQLFWQIIGETTFIVLLAVAIAIALTSSSLPYVKNIASINEQLSILNMQTIALIVCIAVCVTFLAGIYPALIMSGFNPSKALKNKMIAATAGGISLRRSLVVVQFAISQVLIIGTIIAVSQMNFVQKKDLGFNKDGVLMLDGTLDSVRTSRYTAFKQALLKINGVQSVSMNSDAPCSDNNWSSNFAYDHRPNEGFQMHIKFGDADYIKTFGLQLIAGRSYSVSDTANEVVINETMMKMLHVANPNNVIGKVLRLNGKWLPITGVVKDFNDHSLRDEIKPIVIAAQKEYCNETAVKIHTTNIAATKEAIEKTWDKYYPEYANISNFLDDSIAHFYSQENQLSLLYKIFAGIAIFISCLGLYGLISFMTVQKTKEVGIRKVLGASVSSIVMMFSKEFTILIVISLLIAVPVAGYMMNNWLSNFAYRVHLNILFFVLAAIISIMIAWLTVGYKAIKAAIANPVKSLRSE
jgi:putative ABC transport system permease protein